MNLVPPALPVRPVDPLPLSALPDPTRAPADDAAGDGTLGSAFDGPLAGPLTGPLAGLGALAADPNAPAFLVSLAALIAQVEHGPDPVRPALELSRLTVTRMAEELGIPRATLAAYRLGTRRMPAANRARLGEYLAVHAAALARVARALGAGDRDHDGRPAHIPLPTPTPPQVR